MRDLTGGVCFTETYSFAEGGFGALWRAKLEADKFGSSRARSPATDVVVKFPRIRDIAHVDDLGESQIKKQLTRLEREIEAGRHVKHPNILQFLGFCEYPNGRYKDLRVIGIVLPYCSNGNATDFVLKHPEADHLKILCCAVAALVALHRSSPPVIHGDIKGANILIDSNGKALLADVGLSRICDVKGFTTQTSMGSWRWMAAEMHQEGTRTTTASDVWAFGMTILEISTGKPPFAEIKSDAQLILTILAQKARPKRPASSRISDAIWTLLESCWKEDPNTRPDIQRVGLVLDLIYGLSLNNDDSPSVLGVLEGTWDAIVSPGEGLADSEATSLPYKCKWSHCFRAFSTMEECIDHECAEFLQRRGGAN